MYFLFKFIKAKWIFKKPQKKNILIYDRHSEEFAKLLFLKKNYDFLDVRYESVNIYVLIFTFLDTGIKNFKDNYKKNFIKFVSPKIVYTSIDNNPAFFNLKNIYDKPLYISDQNAISKVPESYKQDEFYGVCKRYNQKTKKKLRADYIFLYGKNDKEKVSKIIKGNIHLLGNTINNYYTIKDKKIKKEISSIMFISSTKIEFTFPDAHTKFKRVFEKDKLIFRYLVKFCQINKIKLIFCSRYDTSKEIFHRNNYAPGNWIYSPRISRRQVYEDINKQQMVVFQLSTMGFQALAKGIKCASFYSCFPEKGSNGKFPKRGPFWTNSNKYYDFEKILNKVIDYSNKSWKKIAQKHSSEILSYDPSNIKKKKIIKRVLKL